MSPVFIPIKIKHVTQNCQTIPLIELNGDDKQRHDTFEN